MNPILRNLLTDSFKYKVGHELPPRAMRDVLQSVKEYEDVEIGLRSNLIGRYEIEEFVETLMEWLEPGVRFRHNSALALLAVALEDDQREFAREYLESLANLNSPELGMASRMAEHCLSLRLEGAPNTFGENYNYSKQTPPKETQIEETPHLRIKSSSDTMNLSD